MASLTEYFYDQSGNQLLEALTKGDVTALREILEQGFIPKALRRGIVESSEFWKCNVPFTQPNHTEAIKLLVQFGFPDMAFQYLVYSQCQGPPALEFLKYLLDNGLPLDDFIDDDFTPLHYSIYKDRIDFVSLLLERGADVNKETSRERTPLSLAMEDCPENMVELLLENGADVNEKSLYRGSFFTPITAFQLACQRADSYKMFVLLKHGADATIPDDTGNNCLLEEDEFWKTQEMFAKELAKLSIENVAVNENNLKYLRDDEELTKYYNKCLKELGRMINYVIYSHISLYDVLKMEKQIGELSDLMKNEYFAKKFNHYVKNETFPIYGDILWSLQCSLVTEALNKKIF